MTAARRRSAAGPSAGPQSASVALTALVAVVLAIGVACDPSAVTPSGASSGAPSPTAAGGSAGPPASVRPSASPKADPGTAAVNAFVALVTKDGFSYQATFTGQSRHTTDILPISKGLLQVSGDNVLVKATFAWPSGNKYPVEHRYVGGKGWIKYDPTDPWRRVAIRPTETMGAFMGIRTKTDVTYLGPVKSGGTTYYQVSFRSAVVHPVMIPAINLTEATLSSPKLTLLVDATGKPVKGTAEIVGRGRISGQLQEIVIDLKLTFTKVGQAVTIKAP